MKKKINKSIYKKLNNLKKLNIEIMKKFRE